MSLLSPGSYLRSKLMKSEYDIRSESSGSRIMSVTAREASFFISAGHVFGKLDGMGRLQYLTSPTSAARLKAMLQKANVEPPKNAEDNKTTVLDGKTYQFHMRRVMAWAR